MKTLSIPEFHDAFKALKNDELILDVRTPAEFSQGHVPGAKNIPVDVVMGSANQLPSYKTVYIYCRAGARATVACQILESMGARNLVCVDDGGFPDWSEAGYETQKP
jgi:rhodanese-related sulfurtransferase